ncbi:MAG TPA: hypothetical protein VGK48_02180 [Terriglobia bacterium]|jgi:hypothetical protein
MLAPFQITRGHEEYFLCWQLEDCGAEAAGSPGALRFYDETDALYFLHSLITDSGSMHDFREWLLSESRSFPMYAIADGDLMEQTARMLASGELAAATTAQGEGTADQEVQGEAGQGEGFLRQGGVSAASSSAETTPLQDEMARREETAAASEEAAAQQEQTEEAVELFATVNLEPPPESGADTEFEERPGLAAEEETAGDYALQAETAVGGTAAVGTEAAAAQDLASLETDTDVEGSSQVSADAEAGEPRTVHSETQAHGEGSPRIATDSETGQTRRVKTETDVLKPPALDTYFDVEEKHDGDDDDDE